MTQGPPSGIPPQLGGRPPGLPPAPPPSAAPPPVTPDLPPLRNRRGEFFKALTYASIGAALVGLVVLIAVLNRGGNSAPVAATPSPSPSSSPTPTPEPTPTPTPEPTPTPTPQPTPTPAPTPTPSQPPSQPKVLLTTSGGSSRSTERFVAPTDWDLGYSYDCTHLAAGPGKFVVRVFNGDGTPSTANQPLIATAPAAADVVHYHSGGPLYLQVETACPWTARVTG